jgi:hypothetical protein
MEAVTVMERGKLRGMTLYNGALCIESWQINQDTHVVLAMREATFDPYVVWTANNDGVCSTGDYCQTLNEAIEIAMKRSGW